MDCNLEASELIVVGMLASGYTHQLIALVTGKKKHTVKEFVRSLKQQHGITGEVNLAVFYYTEGWISNYLIDWLLLVKEVTRKEMINGRIDCQGKD